MGPIGSIVLGFFGSVFCFMGLGPVIGWTNPLVLLPIALFGLIAFAAVVALHFLPIAYAIPFRAFYAVAVALFFAATVGMLIPQPTGSEAAGIAAATALWIAALTALHRGLKALPSPT